MAFLENLLRHLGYIKLSTYGLLLTADNRVMPTTAAPPLPAEWQADSNPTVPAAPSQMVPPPLPQIAPPLLEVAPAPTTPPPVPQAASPAAMEVEPPAVDEEEWEWRMAMARARQRGDVTVHPTSAKQVAQMPPPRIARGTAPPPLIIESSAERASRLVAPRPPLKKAAAAPGIGRRLRSAAHRNPVTRAAPRPAVGSARNIRKINQPPPLPPRPDLKLVDPDTVVTAAPRKPSPLPRLTKRMAAG